MIILLSVDDEACVRPVKLNLIKILVKNILCRGDLNRLQELISLWPTPEEKSFFRGGNAEIDILSLSTVLSDGKQTLIWLN